MACSSASPFPRFRSAGQFSRTVNARVHKAFGDDHRFADLPHWLRIGLAFGIGLTAYVLLLAGRQGWVAVACIAIAALSTFALIVQAGHDASHGALSRRRWLNNTMLFVVFGIIGVDSVQWRDRHIRLHHQVTNLPGTGIDADSTSVIRLLPGKDWHWWQRLQLFYGPLLFIAGHLSLVWLEDFFGLLALRKQGRREFLGARALAKFVAGKLVHVTLFITLPILLLSPMLLDWALGYLLASAVISVCFTILVIGTHVSDLADFPLPDGQGNLPHDWATHQVVTSVDWAPENHLAVLLTGGANAHVAHHLFPGYSHRHMDRLSGIVADTAREFGVPYHVTSFSGMALGVWRHIRDLSHPAETMLSR